MTDTGQVPGEGLPENAGTVEQPGIPAPAAYTFLDPSESAAEEDDLLLMPGAQGAWSEHQPGAVAAPPVAVPPHAPAQTSGQPPMVDPLTDPLAGPLADALAAQSPMGQVPPAQQGQIHPSTPAHGVPTDETSGHFASQGAPAHGVATPAHGVPLADGQAADAHGAPYAAQGPATPAHGLTVSAEGFGTPAHGVPVSQVTTEHGYEPGILDTGAHEAAGRDSGSVDLGGVRMPPPAAAPTPPPARRPLHMGPPVPDNTGGVVRSLADRGPAGSPAAAPAPEPAPAAMAATAPGPMPVSTDGPQTTGLEYLDIPQDAQERPAAQAGPQIGDIPPQGAVPWDPQPPQSVAPAETVGQFVPVEGTLPTTPHLAPTPAAGTAMTPEAAPVPETVGEPAEAAETAAVAEAEPAEPGDIAEAQAEEPLATVPAPRDGSAPAAAPVLPSEPETAAEAQPEQAVETASEPVAEAVPASAAEAQPEQVVETVPASAAETASEPSQVVETVADSEPTPEQVVAESAPEAPEPAPEELPAEAEPQAETDAPAAPAAGPGPSADAQQQPAPVAAAAPETEAASVADAVAAPVTAGGQEPGADAEAETAPEALPEAEAAADAEAAPAAETTVAPEVAPAPEVQPAPEADVAPVVAPEADVEAASEAEPRTQAEEPQAEAGHEEAPVSAGTPAPGYDDAEREAVLRVMRERRDIRNGFRSDPIPHEVLLRVLEAAHTAPSVGHSQPWDFVVIRSAETRRSMHELAQRQREAYAQSLPKARAKQFKELKIEAILDTPVNIVVTADPTRGGRHTLGRYTQPQMAPYSSALAVENLWLAARAEGLGVGWVSFFDEREMVRALGLPEHLEVVAYLCVGYVDEFPEEPELMQAGWAKRRPLSWVVHEETYGRRALPGEEPHDLLQETISTIRPLDAKALGEAWERQKRMTKPAGALGMLEIISAQLSGLSRMCPPPIPEPAAVAIFAGDHGVHAQGVTAWPQEVTGQMVANFLGGGAVCNAFANQVGAEVCVIDVGVASELPATPGLLPRKVRPGTGDFTAGLAMTREEVLAAIEVGIETARDLVAAGNKALLTGEMGIANTTASAALISVYTGVDPVEVTGRGTGINDEMHARKVDVVRRALDLHQPDPADPIGVLSAVGGLEHAALVGLILGAASLRTPVVLDGVSTGAAALVARAIAPESLAACIAGHRSAEPGHVAALNKLGLRPLVDLDLRLGEGTGALLALPIVQSAARAMHEVATFDSAGVTEK
ncbi:nicotinate-nucleotide--dimethylbenzimidazole phosphoribosyltransferase [Streptomyces sp. NPDC053755]|uniref:nicotinate-nucleotide--dimethylbenzimidazole phosphoribosyltransferase n=1 Tax=Streptomyces sp. NPDC053755 TaxID=3155815 RepID=UPI00342B2825